MNTKIIVALVIGMALFGVTSAVANNPQPPMANNANSITQNTDSCGLMIGASNMLTQTSDLTAAIYAGKKNRISQTVDQCALAFGKDNILNQNANQKAFILDAKKNLIKQNIEQSEIAFGKGNALTQDAGQIALIDGSDKNKIIQDIDQFQLAFGLNPKEVCACLDKPQCCDPCTLITPGVTNGAVQNDHQTAIIKGCNCCKEECCPIVPPFYPPPQDDCP